MHFMKSPKINLAAGLVAVLSGFSPLASAALVADWQFNTLGDTEGWTAQSFTVNGLTVANAVSGPEVVLTSANLRNQNDPKLYSPTGSLSLSGGATAWETYTIRIRQLGTDNTTPVAFNTSSTIAMLGAGGVPTINPIHNATNLGYHAPVTVTNQANEWNLVSYDISAYSGDILGVFRLDPIQGTDAGGGVIQGNFEIDYITITDNAVPVPEPASLLFLALGGLVVVFGGRFRRKALRT